MSVLEIILYTIIGGAFLTWVGCTIYEWKHPEKVKAKKNAKKAKKLAKKQSKYGETPLPVVDEEDD